MQLNQARKLVRVSHERGALGTLLALVFIEAWEIDRLEPGCVGQGDFIAVRLSFCNG